MQPDWVSPWWQAQCLPRAWDVCGVIVPPLSVWHTFALENVGNRYLCEGDRDKDDAAGLLIVASRTRAQCQRIMDGTRPRALNRALRRMYRKLRKIPWREVDAACTEYVDACLRAPRRWQRKGQSGGRSSVPYQLHLVRSACLYGVTFDAAWDMPYAEARTYYDAHAEASGDTSIMAPEHEALDDKMAAEKGVA